MTLKKLYKKDSAVKKIFGLMSNASRNGESREEFHEIVEKNGSVVWYNLVN